MTWLLFLQETPTARLQTAFIFLHSGKCCVYFLRPLIHILHVWCPVTYMPAWLSSSSHLTKPPWHLLPLSQLSKLTNDLQVSMSHTSTLFFLSESAGPRKNSEVLPALRIHVFPTAVLCTWGFWNKDSSSSTCERGGISANKIVVAQKNRHWFDGKDNLAKAVIFFYAESDCG